MKNYYPSLEQVILKPTLIINVFAKLYNLVIFAVPFLEFRIWNSGCSAAW